MPKVLLLNIKIKQDPFPAHVNTHAVKFRTMQMTDRKVAPVFWA